MKKFLSFIIGLLLPFSALAASVSDIENSQFKEAIKRLIDEDIVSGYSDGTYKPNNLINRAEFLKIVIGALEDRVMPTYDGAKCFTDIDTTQWYADYVCTGKEIGVVGGYTDGSFKPGNNISYAEALSIMFKGFEYTYDDVSGDWTAPYLHYTDKVNIAFGKDYNPHQQITRGDMAHMIVDFMDFGTKKHFVLEAKEEESDGPGITTNYQEEILRLVNLERAKVGQIALKLNSKLNAAAVAHAQDMQDNIFFDHTSSNGDQVQDRARTAGYHKSVGENIGWNYTNEAAAMDGWMNSPGHRNNILADIYLELGVGKVCNNEGGNCYWVQVFGTDWDAN